MNNTLKLKLAGTALFVANTMLVNAQDLAAATPEGDACIAALKQKSLSEGIPSEVVNGVFDNLKPDFTVVANLNRQPEFTTPIWDYLSSLVDDERVADGKQMLQQYQAALNQISTEYGVDAASIVAVWGVESNYGKNFGKRPILESLSALSCVGRRQDFFVKEFIAAMQIIANGDADARSMTGSWAGAFGQTQFMPSTFLRLAVDGNGDGRRDLVANAEDALSSTANYLAKSGWITGQPWGYEVRLPAGFDVGRVGRKNRYPTQHWLDAGVTLLANKANLPEQSAILLPAGAAGPAFMVFKNFDVIYSYNAAESYALAIAKLADQIKGEPGITQAWPTDDPGLSRVQLRELQQLLLSRGHNIGEADGIIGDKSRQAIAAEEQRLGWPVSGRAGQKILLTLRQGI